MTVAAALIIIAIGAILKFAVTATVAGIDLQLVGVILMIVGAVGFVVGLILMAVRRRTDVVSHVDEGPVGRRERTTYMEPTDPTEPRL